MLTFNRGEYASLLNLVLSETMDKDTLKLHLSHNKCYASTEFNETVISNFYTGEVECSIPAYPFLYLLGKYGTLNAEVYTETNRMDIKVAKESTEVSLDVPMFPLEKQIPEYQPVNTVLEVNKDFMGKSMALFSDYRKSGFALPLAIQNGSSVMAVFDESRFIINGAYDNNKELLLVPFHVVNILDLLEEGSVRFENKATSCIFWIGNDVVCQTAKSWIHENITDSYKATAPMTIIDKADIVMSGKDLKESLKLFSQIYDEVNISSSTKTKKMDLNKDALDIKINATMNRTIRCTVKFKYLNAFLGDDLLYMSLIHDNVLVIQQGAHTLLFPISAK